MAPRYRSALGWGAVWSLVIGGPACSLLLNTDPVSCSTNADCAKLTGSHCDLDQGVCVSGDPVVADGGNGVDAGGSGHDGGADTSVPDGGPVGTSDTGSQDTGLIDASGDAADAGVTEPDWNKLSAYLQILYEPTIGLVRLSPTSTEYWTNDAITTARALAYLPTPVTTMSQSILTRLAGLKVCACGDNFGHSADINHLIDPMVHKGATTPIVPNTSCNNEPSEIASCAAGFDAGGKTVCSSATLRAEDHADLGWGGDLCDNNAACTTGKYGNWNDQGQGQGYADLISYALLNYRNRGMDTDAMWADLASKWDGRGMRDRVTTGLAMYETYKLALFKLVTRVLGKPLPPGVDEILAASQGSNGGIRVSSALDGSFSLDQAGSAKATTYVALAYLKPLADF